MKTKSNHLLYVAVVAAGLTWGAAARAQEATTPYYYHPAQSGIEVLNGKGRFNRPLYSSVERPSRLIALAGDRPQFRLTQIGGTSSGKTLVNVKLGLADGQWADEMTPVLARYDRGLQDYRVGEAGAGVEIAAVRARAFDGLLLRVKNSGNLSKPLVMVLGGGGSGGKSDQGSMSGLLKSQLTFDDHTLAISRSVLFISSGQMSFTASDPKAMAEGPKALLGSPADKDAVAALATAWPEGGELYYLLTTDKADTPGIASFRADPAKVFSEAVEDNRRVASVITIDTPDPYLNAALPAAVLGYEAAWNKPTFRHGAIEWHMSFAGWRSVYAGTPCGWHERVQSHVHAFYSRQSDEGRIPPTLASDGGGYNMGEQLVDQALYDYEWSGDLDPLRNGGFDAIARHLAWGEKHVRTPSGLYENFLNAWNTDYKWCNGGEGTIASTYYWRANKTMAEIAKRLGKDATIFEKRANDIAAGMRERLWSERTGVYGEYRDTLGLQLLHESPDLSTIYTPIDLGFCDPFESYRMLRYALRRFETIQGLPRGGKLIYSSEWLPSHYSTRSLYTGEMINTILALYKTGQSEAAEPFRRAIDGGFYAGSSMGWAGMEFTPDGTFRSPVDFTDTTSMYVRNVVEGLFGVRMNAPENRITLQPSFPADWNKASIRCSVVDYQYDWDGVAETMDIKTPQALSPTIRLRARRAEIAGLTINGQPGTYETEPGVGCSWIVVSAPAGVATRVQVTYGKEEMPRAQFADSGEPGKPLTVSVDRGRITQVRMSRGPVAQVSIADDGASCTIPLPSEAGVPTFFVLVGHRNAQMWIPVEVLVGTNEVAAKTSTKEEVLKAQADPVDLSAFRNQRLADLHTNEYEPRSKPFYWQNKEGYRTVEPNGRSWWELRRMDNSNKRNQGEANGLSRWAMRVKTDTSALTAAKGRFVTDNGIPFDIPAAGPDSVFTSRYTNFPNRVAIPVNKRGRKICVLVAASLSLAQSRMENARITVTLGNGTERTLALRDPETIDDWLGSGKGEPYVLSGRPQTLGKGAHAVLQEIDLGEEQAIETLTLETFTEESMVGLLGVTVLRDKEK